MRRVAEELRVTPMALYRHVESKRDLLDGLADLVAREAAAAGVGWVGDDWTARVRRCLSDLRAACLRHPAIVPVLQTTRAETPALLAPMGTVVSALAQAGLDENDRQRAWTALISLTMGHVAYELNGHPDTQDFDSAFDFALTAILEGIRPESTQAASTRGSPAAKEASRAYDHLA